MNLIETYKKIKEDIILEIPSSSIDNSILQQTDVKTNFDNLQDPNQIGMSSNEILGKFDPEKGVMGKDNSLLPNKIKIPKFRQKFNIADGGSIKKKKSKYEKNLKIFQLNKDKKHYGRIK